MISLISHFKHDDSHHSESLRQRKWFIKAREDKAHREEVAEKHEENVNSLATGLIVATELEIQAFEAKLDEYDAATVTALIENQKQLDLVNTEIEALLSRAYIMDDGRRVFKTEDGTQVFDEFGQEVSDDELDFDLIAEDRPKWESFNESLNIRDELETERKNIHAYQEKLDGAREQESSGEMTKSEIEELKADLEDEMPESVQSHVPGMERTATAPDLSNQSKSPETEPLKAEQSASNTVSPSTLQL